MAVFPGLPSPRVSPVLSREESRAHYGPETEFFIGALEVVGNAGTYLDAPFHRFAGAADVSAIPLDRLVNLETVVVRIPGGEGPPAPSGTPRGIPPAPAMGPGLMEGRLAAGSLQGRAVLFHTGWDALWGSGDYFAGGHPFLTRELALRLAAAAPALVGTDACNVDDTADPLRPAHTILLGAGIPILENLRDLSALPGEGARLFAAPDRVEGMASFPVRAFALLEA